MLRAQDQISRPLSVESLDQDILRVKNGQWTGAGGLGMMPSKSVGLSCGHHILSLRKKKSNYYPSSIYASKISTESSVPF